MISSKGFVTQQFSTHSFPPPIPTCPLINSWDKNQSKIHWDECRGTIDRIIINNTLETIIDWGPFGPALQVCNIKECSEPRQLKDQIIGNNLPRIVKTPFNIFWKERVLAPPQLRMIRPIRGPFQRTLWKIALSIGPNKLWKGNFTQNNNNSYTFQYEKTGQIYLQVCLKNPFVFLIGKFTIDQNLKLVECHLCRLFTCLNSSILNYPQDQIMILRRRKGLWIPVQTSRVWEGSPTIHIVLQVLHKILHRTKRFIGLLIAAVLGIIAITTTAAVSGVALHQTVQTTQFVQQWHKNASQTWNQQLKIDQEISIRLADLETTVVYLGNQLESLRTIITLKCDWNISTYCVTPFSYNQTRTPWSEVRAHLLGHMPNLSVNIQQLQREVDQMSSANLQFIPGEDVISAAADELSTLNPLNWIKNLGGGFAGAFAFLIIILFLSCLVIRCGQKTLPRAINEETARSVFLLLHKQKGEDVA